ncbi:MAG: gliding motility-associated C-terminal domain-containing protein [Chitinophagales bacterium]
MRFFKTILLSIAVFTIGLVNAAAPSWSINPAAYQYTMTVTSTAKFSCTESTNPNNMIGAFINGNLAGFTNIDTDINGVMHAYTTVYSNVSGGETVTFKMYDEDTDALRDIIFTTVFQNNASIGSAVSPVVMKTDYDLDSLNINTNIMYEFYLTGQEVGYFSLFDETMSEETATYSFVNDSLGADNGSFSFTDSTLVLEQDVDFLTKTTYLVHVLATTHFGCTMQKNIVLTVVNSNSPPTDIATSPTFFDENLDSGTLVTQFVAVDVSPNDSHTFEFVLDSINFPDNEFFTIVGDSLVSDTNFNFEAQNEYILQVKVTDNLLNFYVDTFTVFINDLVEFTSFEENPVFVDENLGPNLFLSLLTPENLSPLDLHTFSLAVDTSFPDNSFFTLSTDSLTSNINFNFETKNEYHLLINVFDKYNTPYLDTFIVFVNDLEEFTNFEENPVYFDENQEIGLIISDLTPEDLNIIYSLEYTVSEDLTNFPDNEYFQIIDADLASGATYNYEEKDEYEIQIQVTNEFGDIHFDTITVFINDVIEFDDLKAPNFLSPNGDGVNDVFAIPNVEIFETYGFSVFNKNGNKVFSVVDRYDNTWNGVSNSGKNLPSGTYYFTLINNAKPSENFKGKIVINRKSNF